MMKRINGIRGYMFKWHYEFSMEVEESVINFMNDLNNWPMWLDEFESFKIEKIHENKTTILGKIKNKNFYVTFIITEVEPKMKFHALVRAPFFSQENITRFQEIAPQKIKITVNSTITSFFTPFFKSYYRKKAEKQFSILKSVLSQQSRRNLCLEKS